MFPVAHLPCDCNSTQPTPSATQPSGGKGHLVLHHPGLPDLPVTLQGQPYMVTHSSSGVGNNTVMCCW